MSPTKTTSALDQLDELTRAIHEAERDATKADAERRSSGRWLDRAQAKLAAALSAPKRNPDDERQLRDEVTDLQATRVEIDRRGDSVRYGDRRAVERWHDALDAVQDAQSARLQFIAEQRDAIQAEMLERSLAARDRLLNAADELSEATGAWQAAARDWRQLIERWPDMSPGTIPVGPINGIAVQDVELFAAQTRGGARDPRSAIPAPAELVPGYEHEGPLRQVDHTPLVISTQHESTDRTLSNGAVF